MGHPGGCGGSAGSINGKERRGVRRIVALDCKISTRRSRADAYLAGEDTSAIDNERGGGSGVSGGGALAHDQASTYSKTLGGGVTLVRDGEVGVVVCARNVEKWGAKLVGAQVIITSVNKRHAVGREGGKGIVCHTGDGKVVAYLRPRSAIKVKDT